jgi:restriction system protein
MSVVYHYSPDLLQLLVDTIEVLCRSKRDVILFFRGAGVHGQVIDDLAEQVSRDPDSIKKREIAQPLLVLVNEGGDATLRQRQEIVKRVVEWEDFSTCWPTQRLEAQGLVAQVRKRVNELDAFTRMHQAQETERTKRLAPGRAKLAEAQQRRERFAALKKDFGALFGIAVPQQRGKHRGRCSIACSSWAALGSGRHLRLWVREVRGLLSRLMGWWTSMERSTWWR